MPDLLYSDRNEDVREILEDVPLAIFRYGNTIFLLIIIALFTISWFIKYPDILQARITITSNTPPVPIIANSDGELIDIRVSEGSLVKEGEVLAIIKSTTNPNDAFSLLASIEKISINQIEKLIQEEIHWPENLNLGVINENYANFLLRYYEYWRFKKFNPLDNQINEESYRSKEFNIYQQKLEMQGNLFENDIQLLTKDFERDKKLFEQKVISQKQFEDKERQLLLLRRQYQSNLLEISEVKISIADSRKMLSDLTFQKEEKNQSLRLSLFDSYKQLQFSIKNWEKNFVLKSPIDGKVSLFDYWSDNQFVNRFEEIFTVVPTQDVDRIGKVLLPIRNSGKLKISQKAIIKLDDFLFQEFGTLTGIVTKVSLVPRGNLYAVEISLPDGLITSYGKLLTFREEMSGNIEIITEELNLIQRIFYDLKRRLDHQDIPSDERLAETDNI